MKFKPYVLTTKYGRFPEFQLLSIIVSSHENSDTSDFDEI